MTDFDRQLDDDLRRMPLPAGLRSGLTPDALFADAAIDRLLVAVAVPEGLAARVRTAAQAVDARSRNGVVDLTRFVAIRADRLPAQPPADSPSPRRGSYGLRRLVRETGRVAAALGLVFLVASAGIEVSRRLEGRASLGRAKVADAAAAGQAPVGGGRSLRSQTAGEPAGRDDLAHGMPWREGNGNAKHAPPAAAVAGDESLPPATPTGPIPDSPLQPGESVALVPEPQRIRGAAIPVTDRDGPPSMRVVDLPGDGRRQVPKSAAFDLAFEMAHGESPFVDPAADPSLGVDRPPLTLRTGGFDLLVRLGGERRSRSLADRIRVEEVLAAIPAPESLTVAAAEPVRLGLFAVRSGRAVGGSPTVLLEAVAFAAGALPPPAAPLPVTLIVDQAAAGDARAWPRICRGLAAVAGRLAPTERVNVVLCGPRPRVALRGASPAALAAAAVNWEALPAAASTDLDAAVATAQAEGLLDDRTIVVAHAVTLDHGRADVRHLLESWHRALALTGGDPLTILPAAGPRFVILDAAAPEPARDAGPSFGRTSLDALSIRRDLLRQVTGASTLVARQCRLDVRFDPQLVASYRLVGHRQSVVESLADHPPEAIDLHAGETVRVVYEVVPKDRFSIGLATASLSWRTPDGSAQRLEAADRGDGDRTATLPSPHGCELILAATLGELADGSAHTPQPRAAVAALASLADRWQDRGDVTPFGATLIRLIDRQASSSRIGR